MEISGNCRRWVKAGPEGAAGIWSLKLRKSAGPKSDIILVDGSFVQHPFVGDREPAKERTWGD